MTHDDGFYRPFCAMLRWNFEEIETLFPQNPALPSIKMLAKSMHQSFSEPLKSLNQPFLMN